MLPTVDSPSESPLAIMVASYMNAIWNALRYVQSKIQEQHQTLWEQRREFNLVHKEVKNINAAVGNCEYLDVGGIEFHVTRKAMCSHGEHFLSFLGSSVFQDNRDVHGNIFIDRDPSKFPFVLQYLLEGIVNVMCYQEGLRALQREVNFYGIIELQQLLEVEEYLVAASLEDNHVVLFVNDGRQSIWHRLRHASLPSAILAPLKHPNTLYVDICLASWKVGLAVIVYFHTLNVFSTAVLMLHLHKWAWEILSPIAICNRLVFGVGQHLYPLDANSLANLPLLSILDRNHQWCPLTTVSDQQQGVTMCAINETIVAWGGLHSKVVKQLDCKSMVWQRLPDMQRQRSYCDVMQWQGRLVACGIASKSGVTTDNSVEVYDPLTQKWQLQSNLNALVFDMANYNLLVYKGSFMRSSHLCGVSQYDIAMQSWYLLPASPKADDMVVLCVPRQLLIATIEAPYV